MQPEHERRLAARFTIGFSHQELSTDTVAVDLDGNPFRDADGELLFRPGGHGALLDNLGRCGADLAYVKNIDNVVPDHLKGPVVHWKKVLGGLLGDAARRRSSRRCAASTRRPTRPVDVAALALLRDELGIVPPDGALTDALPHASPSCAASSTVRCASAAWSRARAIPAAGPFWVRPQRRGEPAGRRDGADRRVRRGTAGDARGLDLLQPGRPRLRPP